MIPSGMSHPEFTGLIIDPGIDLPKSSRQNPRA